MVLCNLDERLSNVGEPKMFTLYELIVSISLLSGYGNLTLSLFMIMHFVEVSYMPY